MGVPLPLNPPPPPNSQVELYNQKPKEKLRVDSEDYGALLLWFNNLTQVINQHQFLSHEIFNWDETGYRIGQGK